MFKMKIYQYIRIVLNAHNVSIVIQRYTFKGYHVLIVLIVLAHHKLLLVMIISLVTLVHLVFKKGFQTV
jgi:hypothetical protein